MTGNWSSFSTPVAAGVVGLLIQTAKQNAESAVWPFRPRAATAC